MDRTTLLASGCLLAGLVLGVVGTLWLGSARAVAKHARSTHQRSSANMTQYLALLMAVAGFTLIAVGSGWLAAALLPLSDVANTALGILIGLVVFAIVAVVFARVASTVEEGRARRIPSLNGYSRSARPAPSGPSASSPGGTLTVADRTSVRTSVRPGWVYRDQSDRWYLGLVDQPRPGGPLGPGHSLVRLPDFALVDPDDPSYPLHVVGAGEIGVVPMDGPTSGAGAPGSS